jgi:nucleotide-binding universal stress UspA family protein
MIPIKKILCPTDFSEPSQEAMKIASELAFHFNSELCIVHVVSPVPMIPFPEGIPATFDIRPYQQELEASSRKALEELTRQMESNQVRSRFIAVQGNPAHQIIELLKEENPDLMVLATHGKTGWERLIFGSVAEKVIRLAPCPVLLIHQPQERGKEASSERKESVPSEPGKAPPDISSLIQKPKEIILKKKKEYQEKIEAQLKEWEPKIEALKAKADSAKSDAQTIYKEQIENLRQKQDAARGKLKELKDSGEEAWEEVKGGVDKAIEDIKEAFSRAKAKFREK